MHKVWNRLRRFVAAMKKDFSQLDDIPMAPEILAKIREGGRLRRQITKRASKGELKFENKVVPAPAAKDVVMRDKQQGSRIPSDLTFKFST
jgi:hypothetical protein